MVAQLTNPEVIQFIQDHINEDPNTLMLKAKRYPSLPIREIAGQIASRQKVKNKLPEWVNNEAVIFPPKGNLEQASSELTAKFKARWKGGHTFLDLTGGSGVDLFYISDRFDLSTYVETDPELCKIIEHNFELFRKQVSVINIDAESFLKETDRHFDVIYVDPSRRDKNANRVYALEDCAPNVIELHELLITKGEDVVIKASPMLDIKKTLKDLPDTYRVQVLAVDNEVKEILFYLGRGFEGEAEIQAWNISDKREDQEFSFTYSEEMEAFCEVSKPLKYIYDPNAAIRKAGGFHLIGLEFDLKKLHSHTHLYTSNELKGDFPGRIFQVDEIFKPNKKEIKKRYPQGLVNLIAKNYPLKPNELKKKFNLKDGGESFLIFTETAGQGRVAIACSLN